MYKFFEIFSIPERRSVILILLILYISSFHEIYAESLRSGDLIFQVEGQSDFSKAISESTTLGDSLNFVHVGIIEVTENGINVIEASPEAGVRAIPLQSFLKDIPEKQLKSSIVVKRLDIEFPVETVIKKARSHIGEPYDWWYLPDNGKMYCSELVYESYINEDGSKIFKAKPMNFLSPDGSMPEFWVKLFEGLDCEIPQGEEGTNPNDLSADKKLKEVQLDSLQNDLKLQ